MARPKKAQQQNVRSQASPGIRKSPAKVMRNSAVTTGNRVAAESQGAAFMERLRANAETLFPLSLSRDELIQRAYYLEARLGFPSDRALADAVGVHRSQVSRWSQGKLAQRENAWLLRDLASAVSRLADHYEPATIRKWLFAANPEIDDEQPMEALKQGRLPEVLMAIEAQTSGAFA